MLNLCSSCGVEFEAKRRDRRWCTPACKRELKREYDRIRYPLIAEATNLRACQWQRENRTRKRDYDAAYRKINADRILSSKREHSRLNPPSREISRLRAAGRRARKLLNGSYRVAERDLRRSYERHDRGCAYCPARVPLAEIEWDHIVPISRGGAHSIGNLAPSCRHCNRNKGWKFVTEWRLGRVISQYDLRKVAA